MTTPARPLGHAFLAWLPASTPDVDRDALERRLERIVEDARAAWGAVPQPVDDFLRFLAEHLESGRDPLASLASIHGADLFLACACARRDPAALAAFESAFFADLEPALARISSAPEFISEIKQRLRSKLFLAQDGGGPPRIVEYSGRGDLRSWLHVTAVREALSEARRNKREVALDDAMLDATPSAGADPELVHLRAKYEPEFQRAFRAALEALSSTERNLLRYHHIDRLNIDQIGALCRVHRVTAARRLAAVRKKLVDATRRHLSERMNLSPSELQSVLRALQSELHVSLERMLGSREL